MHYYRRNVGDYASKTRHLSTLEHGILVLLTDLYYKDEAPIPDDKAHRLASVTREEVLPVLEEFFQFDAAAGVWRSEEIEADIAACTARGKINQRNGKLGGRPKGSGKRQQQAPAPAAEPPENPPKSEPKPRKKRSVPKPGEEQHSPGFERFWAAYPSGKRSKKLEAWKVWQRDDLEEYADTLVRDIEKRLTMHWGWIKDGGAYIPGAQVYLNGRRWNDDIDPLPRGAGGARTATETRNAVTAEEWSKDGAW